MRKVPDGAHALLVTLEGELFLERKSPRYTFDPRNAGKVAMFGGGIEEGETIEQALCRELQEELELTVDEGTLEPLGVYQKTEEEDGMDCTVHTFVIRNIDPAPLVLHEGDHEDTGIPTPPDHNKNIIRGTPEALLARTDLTRVTRLAIEDHILTRCTCHKPENIEILREFEASLTLPPKPTGPQFLVCPIGEIGAGKTTVLKLLSERLALLRSAGDDLRKVFKDHGRTLDDLYDCAEGGLWGFVRKGYNIAVDGDCSSTRMQNTIRAIQHSHGVQVFWVHVNPPESYILNKLRTREHTWLFRDAEHAVESYFKRKATREHPTVPYIYEFDTSRDDLEKQVDEATLLIKHSLSVP